MHWMTKIRFLTGVGFFFFAVASKPGFIPVTGYRWHGGIRRLVRASPSNAEINAWNYGS